MNRKEFNLLVEGWKSFLSEAEIPTIHQGPDPVQALGGRSAGVSSEEMTGEESEDMPPMYIENPNPEYDLGGMPIRSQILNPEHPAHEDHPRYSEYMKRTNENISESRLRSIIKSVINESSESYKNELLSGYKELIKRCYAEIDDPGELTNELNMIRTSYSGEFEAEGVSALEIMRAENEARGIEVPQS